MGRGLWLHLKELARPVVIMLLRGRASLSDEEKDGLRSCCHARALCHIIGFMPVLICDSRIFGHWSLDTSLVVFPFHCSYGRGLYVSAPVLEQFNSCCDAHSCCEKRSFGARGFDILRGCRPVFAQIVELEWFRPADSNRLPCDRQACPLTTRLQRRGCCLRVGVIYEQSRKKDFFPFFLFKAADFRFDLDA